MYIFDFIKNLVRRRNIPILIYLIVNIFIIALLTINTFDKGWVQAFVVAMIIYFISLVIALSPIGETLLRWQNGCRRIKRQDYYQFIHPIFEEVYAKAKAKDPHLSSHIRLFMTDDVEANAFATGRKTICITKGMLNAPVGEIKAVLSHEFGHLSHKDTDLILVVSVGNFIVTAFFVTIRLFARFISFIFQIVGIFAGEVIVDLGAFLSGVIIDFILIVLMRLWTRFGMLLVMKSSRDHEYEADEFAAELGYGIELCRFLDKFDGEGFKGLFASLVSTHPANDKRIANLQEKGVEYYLQRQ